MTRFDRTPQKTKRAKALREKQTDAEQKLWRALKGKQLDGVKFRRQHPVGDYILDFYCPAAQLCVEVDGGQHNEPANSQRDAIRTSHLEKRGITVMRVWNFEIFENLDGVLEAISEQAHYLVREAETERDQIPSP